MKTWLILAAIISCSLYSFDFPPTRTITGKVTSAEDGSELPGVSVTVKATAVSTYTDANGNYAISIQSDNAVLVFSFIGLITQEVNVKTTNTLNVALVVDLKQLDEIVVVGYGEQTKRSLTGSVSSVVFDKQLQGRAAGVQVSRGKKIKIRGVSTVNGNNQPAYPANSEEYAGTVENRFYSALHDPLSTFSIDVDAASYSNVRRFINNGQRPPKDAVRVEEMINYFTYDYPQPKGDDPFNIITEISTAPWNNTHKLVSVALQGKRIPTADLPASNLVFLIDVSGSMADANKLPLLKSSFKILVNQLREKDRVAIVVYAGAAGLVLEPTSGANKERIIEAMDNLEAGGSTAGGAGLTLAYRVAKENFIHGGNNRVILATDGDFNVGASSDKSMEALIEEKRKDGIFLTVLGFGMGNYKDSKMEILADKGNGNYAYIDNFSEARKVLVTEFGGTLFTIAKDVKLQVEFNPARVKAYRLIGYENRLLEAEDFADDRKDAGELGPGHTVTALYEIIPTGVESEFYKVDDLKYQQPAGNKNDALAAELMTVKFRYKKPTEYKSKLITHPVIDQQVSLEGTSDNFRWAASVAAFGMLLRESDFVRGYTYDQAIQLAEGARGKDAAGYRIEFITLAKAFGSIASRQ